MNSMAFHGGVTETILFKEWRTTDWNGMSGSMVGIILLTIIYEGLKSYRDHLFKDTAISRKKVKRTKIQMLFSTVHFLQAVLHVVQMIIGYFLMLIFMTYNVWLCIAMVIGTGLGYWLFAWEKSDGENTDCCS
ncbi:hypothetical protein KPH14_006529 [Odynerus spinipes]|uniref:Copper transport protein n=1 Tax=Odynerus spinipes TaxID=1348599 RepID=A0AAD9VRC8_9HYME|nr:hypothetical protein KPH14_006529 [Odynerus spinipes]